MPVLESALICKPGQGSPVPRSVLNFYKDLTARPALPPQL